jgi:hypothetical protein
VELLLIILLILLLCGGGAVWHTGVWAANSLMWLVFVIFLVVILFGAVGGSHYHWW